MQEYYVAATAKPGANPLLIVVSAESACCESVWIADINDDQIIHGVCIKNPLV
jgi:hypothetical protein